jgi:hypothetical protein
MTTTPVIITGKEGGQDCGPTTEGEIGICKVGNCPTTDSEIDQDKINDANLRCKEGLGLFCCKFVS